MADRIEPDTFHRRFDTKLSTVKLLSGRALDLDRKGLILQLHEDYLKSGTAPGKMGTIARTGQPVSEMIFEEWLKEALILLDDRITDFPDLVILGKLQKQDADTGINLCKQTKDYILWFLALPAYKRHVLLNENKLSDYIQETRTPQEVAAAAARDFQRAERAAMKTPQLNVSEMKELLREAGAKTGMGKMKTGRE